MFPDPLLHSISKLAMGVLLMLLWNRVKTMGFPILSLLEFCCGAQLVTDPAQADFILAHGTQVGLLAHL